MKRRMGQDRVGLHDRVNNKRCGYKIAFVSAFHGLGMGGAEVSSELIAAYLQRLFAYRVHIFTARWVEPRTGLHVIPGTWWIPTRALLFGHAAIDSFLSGALVRGMRRVGKPDLIHAQEIYSLAAAVMAGHELGVPVVATVRDPVPRVICRGDYPGWLHPLMTLVLLLRARQWMRVLAKPAELGQAWVISRPQLLLSLRDCAAIISVSDYIRHNLVSLGLEAQKVVTIYNIPDNWQNVNDDDVTCGIRLPEENGLRVLAAGRLVEEKGFHVLVEALHILGEQVRSWRVIFAGEGSYRRRLESMVEARGLAQVVRFLGTIPHSEMGALYRWSDIVVCPSVFPEPLGRVALEGMSAGRPVVASRAGGSPEIIVPKETGLLVPPGDAVALAEALQSLAKNRAEREEMGQRAKMRAAAVFSPDVLARQTAQLYQHVLQSWHAERSIVG